MEFIASWEGHDEVIQDALSFEPSRAGIPFSREKNYEINTKELSCYYYYADFVVWDKNSL